LVSLILAVFGPASADVGPTYAIKNAKIVPVTGPAIENGVLIIRNGLISAQAKPAKVIAIRGAKIIPVVGAEIDGGTILIRDGKIDAVGRDVAIPSGAEIVDAQGLCAYPGLIDAYSFLGLQEISGVSATVDNRETGRINPQVRAIEAVRYDSMHIPIARSNGITAALVASAISNCSKNSRRKGKREMKRWGYNVPLNYLGGTNF
jgi:imidazolonepropionase-like amidohydrolase